MNKTILWVIVGLIIVGGVVAVTQKDKNVAPEEEGTMATTESSETSIEISETERMDSESSVSESTPVTNAPSDAPLAVGTYEAYSPEKLALADSGDVVLFFHATWCPTCRALSNDIEKSLSDIPRDVSILKLDYDKETALKQKYGVTTQHTLVQVDAQGNLIKKWSGGSNLESIIQQVQ